MLKRGFDDVLAACRAIEAMTHLNKCGQCSVGTAPTSDCQMRPSTWAQRKANEQAMVRGITGCM